MRLDKYLQEQGFVDTRSKAQDAIAEQRVQVNGMIIQKNSFDVKEQDEVVVLEKEIAFVSRAGYKLYDVLEPFEIDLKDRVCVDVGASTGGFTHVCLKEGAKSVYAFDVGSGQMHPSLLSDPRLHNFEHVNCRYLTKEHILEPVDFACIDVSFISLKQILPSVLSIMDHIEIVALVKPQFEVGKDGVNKHGIVRNEQRIYQVLIDMQNFIEEAGGTLVHACASSILGRDGNKEFVFHIKEKQKMKSFDFRSMIKNYASKR